MGSEIHELKQTIITLKAAAPTELQKLCLNFDTCESLEDVTNLGHGDKELIRASTSQVLTWT